MKKGKKKEKLIKNKIANALHYYRSAKEPNLSEMVDSLYCLMIKGKMKKKCLKCGHEFKNYKWKEGYPIYDGDVACCPKCLTPALEMGI